jgi:hypothetical protein
MHFIPQTPFWYLFDGSVAIFLFQTPSASPLSAHYHSARAHAPWRPSIAHRTLQEGARGHPRPMRDAALRPSPNPSPTTPVCGTGWEQSAVTPSTDAYNALAEASCKACESASKRLKHTCTKAKHTGKRHTSPSVDIRHAKRSGTGPAAALTAPEAVQIPVASLAIDRGSSDVGVRAGEMHVLSEALSHISSSSEALHPSHLPVPTLIMEQGEASDVDGDVVMAEGDAFARDTRIANQAVDGLAPRACEHEVVPPPSHARVPSAEENDHLLLPPEGSFVCVALQDGVLPPELNVFTNIASPSPRPSHDC